MNAIVIYPEKLHALLTGAWMARKQGECVTLVYTDGSEETATIPNTKWGEIRENWFAIVSEVQGKRQ